MCTLRHDVSNYSTLSCGRGTQKTPVFFLHYMHVHGCCVMSDYIISIGGGKGGGGGLGG